MKDHWTSRLEETEAELENTVLALKELASCSESKIEALRKERDDAVRALEFYSNKSAQMIYMDNQDERIQELEAALKRTNDAHGCECKACENMRAVLVARIYKRRVE